MDIPTQLKDKTIRAILKHAESGYPQEICGVVVMTEKGEKYVKCKNIASNPEDDFKMCPESYMDAEEQGDVVGVVHSHPDGTTRPSSYDLAVMSVNRELELRIDTESLPTPWHIVSWPEGDYRQIIPEVHESLLGRQFVHGVWDCWQVCNDYYKRVYGIEFERFEREDCWWEIKDGPSLYESFFEGAGFYAVDTPQPGDMIVMQIGRSYHPNHAAIYLGDAEEFEGKPLFGGPFMLHHMYGRKSEVTVYGGQWYQRTRLVLRHKEAK